MPRGCKIAHTTVCAYLPQISLPVLIEPVRLEKAGQVRPASGNLATSPRWIPRLMPVLPERVSRPPTTDATSQPRHPPCPAPGWGQHRIQKQSPGRPSDEAVRHQRNPEPRNGAGIFRGPPPATAGSPACRIRNPDEGRDAGENREAGNRPEGNQRRTSKPASQTPPTPRVSPATCHARQRAMRKGELG